MYSAQYTSVPGITRERYTRQIPSEHSDGCPAGLYELTSTQMSLGIANPDYCTVSEAIPGRYCCSDPTSGYWSAQ